MGKLFLDLLTGDFAFLFQRFLYSKDVDNVNNRFYC